MLITEGFVAARGEWKQVVAASRQDFLKRQLRLAVRQDPVTAREELEAIGQ